MQALAQDIASMDFELPVVDTDYHDVPGWDTLQPFLTDTLGITSLKAIEDFRKFYNHYLKRCPIHYFSEKTIPEVDFAVYFPINKRRKGINHTDYLTIIAPKGKPMVIFERRVHANMKSRTNFYRLTLRMLNEGKFEGKQIQDVRELEGLFNDPHSLHTARRAKFFGFLKKAENAFHRKPHRRYFKGKWDQIKKFLNERDFYFIEALILRMRTQHVSFEIAHLAAKTCGSYNLEMYNWIAAGTTEEIKRNRMQVSEHFPWLARCLSNDIGRKGYEALEKVIDEGGELIPALQDVFSDDTVRVSQSTVRKTHRLNIAAETRYHASLKPLMQSVSMYLPHFQLEPNYLEKLFLANDKTGDVCKHLGNDFFEIFEAMSPEEKAGFLSPGDMDGRARAWANTLHFMLEVYAKLVLPYFVKYALDAGYDSLSEAAEQYIRGALEKETFLTRNQQQCMHAPNLRPFGNMAFPSIVSLSQKWHEVDNMRRYVSRTRGMGTGSNLTWPKLFTGKVMAPNGIEIENLGSKDDLFEEHREMNHCVFSYAPQCATGVDTGHSGSKVFSHLFRMAAAGRRHRATLGLFELSGTIPPQLTMDHVERRRTHKNVENHAPQDSPEYAAGYWLLKQINKGVIMQPNKSPIVINWEDVRERRKKSSTARPLNQIFTQIGVDPREKYALEEMYLNLRPFGPERFRTTSYADWVHKMAFEHEARWLFPPRILSAVA